MAEDLIDDGTSTDDVTTDDGTQTPADDGKQTPDPKKDEGGTGNDSTDDLSDDATGDLLSDDGDDGQSGGETSYELDVPEELQGVAYGEEALQAFKDAANKMGLSQEQFQQLAEFDMRNALAANEAAVDEWNNRVQGWKDEVRNDPDVGGENLKASKANVKAVVDKFGDKELKAVLSSPTEKNPDGLAFGNHPALWRFLNRIGKALADPDFEDGEEAVKDQDTLRKMYPSMYED